MLISHNDSYLIVPFHHFTALSLTNHPPTPTANDNLIPRDKLNRHKLKVSFDNNNRAQKKTHPLFPDKYNLSKFFSSKVFSSLAPWERAQASRPPTKFLIAILKLVNFWHIESVQMDLDKNHKSQIVDCVAHVHSSEMVTQHVIKICHDQTSFHD